MQVSRRRLIGSGIAVAGVGAASLFVPRSSRLLSPPPIARESVAPASLASARRPSHSPLIDEALAALDRHGARVPRRDRIAVADFSLPSREPRFHLVEVASGRVERSFLVAHGSGSDPAKTGMLHRFSNEMGSNATSRGAFLTGEFYLGKHGPSQRLIGLDPENDLALERNIVVHGAPYVDPGLVAVQGCIGRSQGCFALEPAKVATVMAALGEGRMIYAGKPA